MEKKAKSLNGSKRNRARDETAATKKMGPSKEHSVGFLSGMFCSDHLDLQASSLSCVMVLHIRPVIARDAREAAESRTTRELAFQQNGASQQRQVSEETRSNT